MPEPSYDFFATGRPVAPAGPDPYAAPVVPAVNQFGTPLAPPSGASAPVPPASAGLGGPVAVNQFGTPVDLVPTPTGPFAAPGIGAAPVAGPGMLSTWAPGPAHARASHAAAPAAPALPRNVRAVAILALFFGVLLGIVTLVGFSGYATLSALVDGAGSTPQARDMYGAMLTVVLVGLLILAACTLFLLVGGAATLANRRWGGWMLVVAFGLYLLGQLRQLAESGMDLVPMLSAAIAVALFLALVTGEGRQWLMHR